MVRAARARALRHDGRAKKWLRSPAGWALASVWYDTYPGAPPRGSPLETLFLFVRVQRTENELLATRSMVRSQWALLTKSPEAAKAAFDGYQNYAEGMFPFLERAKSTSTTDEQRLLEFVKRPMEIDMSSLRHQRAEQARAKALRKFSTKPR